MAYLGELRDNVRPLAAASLGVGTGLSFFAYTNAVFAPFLIEEFGWSRSQFALVGLTMIATLVFLPIIGRFADRFGVRRTALIGTIALPLLCVAFALQTGSFTYYLVVATLVLIAGSTTSPLVYTRLIAENIRNAQGLALTIVTSTPALLGALAARPLTDFNQAYGWRNGYLVIGAVVFVANLTAILLIPSKPKTLGEDRPVYASRPARVDFGEIVRSPTFWVLVFAFFLCMLPTPIHSTQMNVMLLDNGLTMDTAATMVSTFAIGSIVGRLICGLALDRYSARVVAALSMGIPAVSYFVLATPYDVPGVIAVSMFLMGMAVGAENDLLSFLVAKYFRLDIFSSTLSLLFTAVFLSSAVGAVLISATLARFDSFAPFMYLMAGTAVAGALLFLLLPRGGRAADLDEALVAGSQVLPIPEGEARA